MNRPDLLTQAVVEAARRYMAANLWADRAGGRDRYVPYQDRVNDSLDALQDLRDALAAQRRSK